MSGTFIDDLPVELKSKVQKITSILPHAAEIFEEVYKLGQDNAIQNETSKRKIAKTEDANQDSKIIESNIIFQLKDVSVLSPLRKKLTLAIHLSDSTRKPVLSLLNNDKSEISIDNLKENIKLATFLPFPEKNNLVYFFISHKLSTDPILININKDHIIKQFKQSAFIDQDAEDFSKCIEYMRKQAILTSFRIFDPFSIDSIKPDNNVLNSSFVNAHKGTKEGTLYFLPNYIIFGFKKPILLFESDDIDAITYSSITRLTFNITLITKTGEKFEFSMIDQSDYNKIDVYVKTKQVIDKSMSDELRAKTSKQNKQTEEPTALEAAKQQMSTETAINGLDFDSDDDEDDQDFQSGQEEDENSDSNTDQSEAEEVNSEDEEEEVNDIMRNITSGMELPYSLDNTPGFANLENISISLNDDDDDDGSGVEYE